MTTAIRERSGTAPLDQLREEIDTSRIRLLNRERFDLRLTEGLVAKAKRDSNELREALKFQQEELSLFEGQLREHYDEMSRLQESRTKIDTEIATADRFEKELTAAADGRSKAAIHKECEERLGVSSPVQAIRKRREQVASLERSVAKIQRRIEEDLEKFDRTIDHLIVDRNNACYQGDTFIGIAAIMALVAKVVPHRRITIIFDHCICHLLKVTAKDLERTFRPHCEVFVAPSKSAADEYIIRLAEGETTAYVLSNDRFADYHDFKVVETGRLMPFMIANRTFMIADLNFSIRF